MNDQELALLPADAIHAVKSMAEFACDLPGAGPSDWNIVLHHLLRLARENAALYAQFRNAGNVSYLERMAMLSERAERAEAELAALKRWAQEARGYLTAAAESSMSRNNSEEIAGELLDDLAALLPVGGENER